MLPWILAFSAIVTYIAMWRARGEVRPGLGGTYLIVVGLLHHMPTAMAKFTNSYVYGRNLDGGLSVLSLGWADLLFRVADIGTLAATAGLFLCTLCTQRVTVCTPTVLLMSMVAIGMLSRLVIFDDMPSGQPWLLLLALLAAGTATASMRAIVSGAAVLTLLVALSGTLLAVANPDAALSACVDKCTIIGEVFTGTSSHGNALALFLTLGLPFVWLAFGGRVRLWMTVYLGFLIAISGSRTSLAAAGVVVLVLIATRPQLVGSTAVSRAHGFAKLMVTLLSAVGILLPFLIRDDLFATGRGYLWRIAREYLSQSPFIGLGSRSWARLYQMGLFGEAAEYATHNQWLESIFISGLVGGLLFAAAMISLVWHRDPGKRAVTTPIVTAILALGILERPIGIDLVAGTSWALLGMLMLSNAPTGFSASPYSTARPRRRVQHREPIPVASASYRVGADIKPQRPLPERPVTGPAEGGAPLVG